MKELRVFVGGPADGQRTESESPTIMVPVPSTGRAVFVGLNDSVEGVQFEQHPYHREVFSAGGKDFYIYRYCKLTTQDVVAALLSGYRPVNY